MKRRESNTDTTRQGRKAEQDSMSADVMANDYDAHEHILRPRPRKPQHSQVEQVSRMSTLSDTAADGFLGVSDNASTTSGLTR